VLDASGLEGEGEVGKAPGSVSKVWCGQRRAHDEEGQTVIDGAWCANATGCGCSPTMVREVEWTPGIPFCLSLEMGRRWNWPMVRLSGGGKMEIDGKAHGVRRRQSGGKDGCDVEWRSPRHVL
jgi:hypothetical protein